MKASRKPFSPGILVCLLAALLCLVLGLNFYFSDTTQRSFTHVLVGIHNGSAGRLNPEETASQQFTVAENDLSAVEVMVATYGKRLHEGTLILVLTDAAGAELGRTELDVNDLRDSAYTALTLEQPLSRSAGQVLTLTASADCQEQKGISVSAGKLTAEDPQALLTMADGSTDAARALNLRYTCTHTVYGTMDLMTCLLIALCFLAVIPLCGRRRS